jgi:SAM-dependent methyltransferase
MIQAKPSGIPYADPRWRSEFIRFAVARTGLDHERVALVVERCAAEVPVGHALVEGLTTPDFRILEVCAGIGLLAYDLRHRGLNVVALKPGSNEFGDSARIGAALSEFLADDLPVLDKEASGLDPFADGRFDLIFSVDVLEHIPDLEANLEAMLRVLSPDRVMAHTYAYYHVPDEPHFVLPLVPGFPQAITLLKPQLREDELWRSLNFITTSRVRRFAKRAGLDVVLARGLLYDAIRRIDTDPAFSKRYRGLVPMVYGILKRLGLIGALRYLPSALAMPMGFRFRRASGASA